MPRVHFVKRARKRNPVAKRGESYYWWQFWRSGKSYSKVRPRPSQLTRSEFLGTVYSYQEEVDDAAAYLSCLEDVETLVEVLKTKSDEIRELGDEQQEKRDNMPEQLQDVGSGELLGERVEECETLATCLEDAASEIEALDHPDEDDEDEFETFKTAVTSIIDDIDWSVS